MSKYLKKVTLLLFAATTLLTVSCNKDDEKDIDHSLDGTKWATKIEDWYYFKSCDVIEFFDGQTTSYDADENYHITSSASTMGTGKYRKDGSKVTFQDFVENHNSSTGNYTITFLSGEITGTIMKVQYEYKGDTTRINTRTYTKI